ncbi:hypothetical protein BT96DRAFT_982432 [Gymnopus androsaceus JB14]|uniref:Uncharacterized protein n=1 Tax=Gymnopus androsaceus JB14 TaxID=1447944 RepID=A0A6A4GE44_9AGAR|nr:hypothetical protein BT96DRAFT_982432 [Gymnopus androsaceus JB14]
MLALVFLLSAFATSVLATVTGPCPDQWCSRRIVYYIHQQRCVQAPRETRKPLEKLICPYAGDLVEAACVDTSVDRQITPATNTAGTSVLLIERQYGAAQAASLVGVTPCIGFNGTDFVAQDCDTMTAPVTFVSGELVAGTACSTGVNSLMTAFFIGKRGHMMLNLLPTISELD